MLHMCRLNDDVAYVTVVRSDIDRNYSLMADNIMKIMAEHDRARLVFASDANRTYSKKMLLTVWQYLVEHDIQVGQDAALPMFEHDNDMSPA